jgi:hypothetical protein
MRGIVIGGVLAAMGVGAGLPATAADFDARRPKDVLSVVTTNGASGELKAAKDGKPYIDAKAGKIFFDVDFYDCDDAKALCTTQNFYASWTSKDVTVEQMNRWNRWTLWCPGYLDKDGEPNMWSNTPVYAHETREDVVSTVDGWMGCLRDFDAFVANPEDVLKQKEAPAKP